jgi:hypothetical protein
MHLHRRVRHGNLIDFHVLGTRQFRSKQPHGDGLKPQGDEVPDPSATILGAEQRDTQRPVASPVNPLASGTPGNHPLGVPHPFGITAVTFGKGSKQKASIGKLVEPADGLEPSTY